MIISLLRMPPDGLSFRHQYAADELDLNEHDFEFETPPLAEGRVDRAGMDMRVRGRVKSKVISTCDRCLNEVVIPIDAPFDLLYLPEDPGAGESGETELHDRDLDLAVYENDQITLDDLVLEQLELNLPSRVLCREDCRGLCPQCGADLNVETCQCPPPVDPRWQALAELKNKLEE